MFIYVFSLKKLIIEILKPTAILITVLSNVLQNAQPSEKVCIAILCLSVTFPRVLSKSVPMKICLLGKPCTMAGKRWSTEVLLTENCCSAPSPALPWAVVCLDHPRKEYTAGVLSLRLYHCLAKPLSWGGKNLKLLWRLHSH